MSEYDTDLTRMSEKAVEEGVNEIDSGESNHDNEFKKKSNANLGSSHTKKTEKKQKKAQRQNRKKGRR